jgi:immunoglobulin-binding protein 1
MSSAEAEDNKPMSLSAQLAKAQALMGDQDQPNSNEPSAKTHPLVRALSILENLQEHIQQAAIFSTNEYLSDIQTSSLPLLAVEFHMAKVYLQLRTSSSTSRNTHVKKAVDLFHLFLHRCDNLEGILDEDVKKQYSSIPDINPDQEEEFPSKPLPQPSRDEKIARYRQSKELKNKIAQMIAQLSQRKRLDMQDHEEMEGHDEDSLLRAMYLHQMNEFALDTVDELYSSTMELQMLQMAVKMDSDRDHMDHHRQTGRHANAGRGQAPMDSRGFVRPPPPDPSQRMKMTQVLQDPLTGELIFKKQELQAAVFRPSWNQPTMSLEDLGDKEVREAIEREAKQKVAEEKAKDAPRRYEYLVRDGMEDNADLVDASAKIDREWDDWKAENPKGSGNKMGDRGDRNF